MLIIRLWTSIAAPPERVFDLARSIDDTRCGAERAWRSYRRDLLADDPDVGGGSSTRHHRYPTGHDKIEHGFPLPFQS